MTDSFDEYQIDLPSATKSVAGRYDKLLKAGMATRFVKGTSGNPSGRPKRRPSGMSRKELTELFRDRLVRA
jgi:hypothetical protein